MEEDYIGKCVKRAKIYNMCPNCSSELTAVINGDVWRDKAIRLRKSNW